MLAPLATHLDRLAIIRPEGQPLHRVSPRVGNDFLLEMPSPRDSNQTSPWTSPRQSNPTSPRLPPLGVSQQPDQDVKSSPRKFRGRVLQALRKDKSVEPITGMRGQHTSICELGMTTAPNFFQPPLQEEESDRFTDPCPSQLAEPCPPCPILERSTRYKVRKSKFNSAPPRVAVSDMIPSSKAKLNAAPRPVVPSKFNSAPPVLSMREALGSLAGNSPPTAPQNAGANKELMTTAPKALIASNVGEAMAKVCLGGAGDGISAKDLMHHLGNDAAVANLLKNGDEDNMEAILKEVKKAFVPSAAQKAEALQIKHEIEKQDLRGEEALAFVFAKHLGTSEAAFKWLDFSGTGRFTRLAFEAAMVIFHVDIETITGKSRQALFSSLDARRTGSVSKGDWTSFFIDLPDSPMKKSFCAKLGLLKSLAPVLLALTSLPALTSEQREGYTCSNILNGGGYTCSSSAPTAVIEDPAPADVDYFYLRVRSELSALALNGRHVYETLKRQERVVVETVAAEFKLLALQIGSSLNVLRLSDEAGALWLQLQSLQPGTGVALEDIANALWEVSWTMAQHLRLWCCRPNEIRDASCEFGVFKIDGMPMEFKSGIRATLGALPPGGIRRFPMELGKERSGMVETVATELGMWCASLPAGTKSSLYVGNLNKFVEQKQTQLFTVAEGQSMTFASMRPLEHHVFCLQVSKLGLQCNCVDRHSTTVTREMVETGEETKEVMVESSVEPSKDELQGFLSMAFDKYACQRSTMHKSDVSRLVKDLRNVQKVGARRNSLGAKGGARRQSLGGSSGIQTKLETLFDEAMVLQEMFSNRPGLTLRCFGVFMDKASRALGTSIGSMLDEVLKGVELDEGANEAPDLLI